MNYSKKSYVFKIQDFFLGRLYPLILCLLILTAQVFSLEHIILPIIVIVACISLWLCNSIKPIVAPLCGFLYALSSDNKVFGQEGSDYYFTGWRVIAIYVLAALAVLSFIVFLTKTHFFRKMRERGTPGLVPLLLFSAAFLINGVGTEYWQFKNLIFGTAQIAAYFIVYILFYHGMSDDEEPEDIGEYFSYICALISAVIAIQLAVVYITNNVFVDGVIIRENIVFGWGACNTLGIITLLIPLNFYAAYRAKRHAWIYLITATLAYLTAIFSISRNALLIGSIVYLLSLFIYCFFGDKKRFFRVYALLIFICFSLLLICLREQAMTAFESYIDRGLGDSGRFDIWKKAWNYFLTNPVFGNGFASPVLYENPMVSFIPKMAHNTIIQILFSMGGFGIASYAVYRASTLIPYFRSPSIMKFSYGLLVLALISIGLLDNFAFHIQPVFFYSIAMAIVQRATCDKKYF